MNEAEDKGTVLSSRNGEYGSGTRVPCPCLPDIILNSKNENGRVSAKRRYPPITVILGPHKYKNGNFCCTVI